MAEGVGDDDDSGDDPGPDVDLVTLRPGQAIGRYRVVAVLGQGGFGITYRAVDAELGRQVAIKEYLPAALAVRKDGITVVPRSRGAADDLAWGLERFVSEGRTLAALQRAPGIVKVHDFLQANGTAYLVMELVDGETLDERIRRGGPLDAAAIDRILAPLLDGLEQVHTAGFLHRDIKPANILLDERGRPTLIDFGASRAAVAGRTQAMTAVFTPGYAPVEQFTSGAQGAWTDIYSLAATLYHAITGAAPDNAIDRMVDDTLVPLAGSGRAFPKPLLAGIDAALVVRAAARPQSVAAWRALLSGTAASPATVVMTAKVSEPPAADASAKATATAAPPDRPRGLGTGTSQDMSTVLNFTTGSSSDPIDMIDISIEAFSDLLRAADGNDAQIGVATFSNMVGLGGTITVADANVILITSNVGFANAADLAAALLANPITFASAQTEQFNHYIVAYQDFDDDVRIADMNIHANGMTSFTTTAGGATLAISDMAELDGVSLASLQAANINFVSNDEIANSSYLDFTGYGITTATTVVEAYGLNQANVQAATTAGINVAIILDRVTDPTSLLSQNWGTRQQTLAQLESAGTLWDTYGADQAQYDAVVAELQGTYGLTVLSGNTSNGNYVSSADSRTIWVAIDTPEQFLELFGQTLYYNNDGNNSFLFWNGNLALPSEWNVQGLWFDTENSPPPSNMAPGVSGTLNQGAQGIGNTTASVPNMAPQDIAALYNFPLIGQNVATGTIALIEPGIGNAVRNIAEYGTFDQRLATYLQSIGQSGTGTVYVQGANGQDYAFGDPDERSQDVGTVAAVNPNSNIGLYVGSGYNGNADASTFTALQSAIWDTTNNPGVISNSFGDLQSMSPNSPFYQAYWQLYVDAALRNQTLFSALGDGGSGNETGNGLTNVEINLTSPYAVLVGGTSLSTLATAQGDPTLSSIVESALADDPSTIWQLMAGGLTSLPDEADALQAFVETVWNTYQVTGATIGTSSDFWGGYLQNTTTSGGVDPTQPAPWYQTAYGLNPVTSDPLARTGRGVPDVSANAGGNLQYLVPNGDLTENTGQIGTSSAAPFWAALTVQFNAIFADQDLPQLGYMNDLLYIASAIAPAAFNDVTLGGNMSSFSMGGSYSTLNADGNGYVNVTPTGYGYYAGPGYDLVTGLGSPNGLLLARTLTSIAHSQISFSSSPDMLDADGNGWTSGANQSLLFQTMSGSSANVSLDLGSDILSFSSVASGTYAWTNRVAQQSMQDDFDPNLVRLFDRYGQGAVTQSVVSQGESIGVSINASAADAIQGALSSPFGFADFVTDSGVVRVARPVAVAETVGAQDDQTAIVRLRQNGEDSLSVSFYRVDDLTGSIDGIQVGQAGYAQAAQGRAYQVSGGGTSIGGPGYGNFGQSTLLDVDAGDLIAMKLVNQTTNNTYWAFAQGNEMVSGQSVGHLWNYGLNTWGWEDMRNGGDRDFNDLIVQFDFTSAYGNHWLV